MLEIPAGSCFSVIVRLCGLWMGSTTNYCAGTLYECWFESWLPHFSFSFLLIGRGTHWRTKYLAPCPLPWKPGWNFLSSTGHFGHERNEPAGGRSHFSVSPFLCLTLSFKWANKLVTNLQKYRNSLTLLFRDSVVWIRSMKPSRDNVHSSCLSASTKNAAKIRQLHASATIRQGLEIIALFFITAKTLNTRDNHMER